VRNTTATERRLAARVWDFFTFLTGGHERDFEEQRKRSVLSFFLIVGIIVAVPFCIKNMIIGNVARAIVLLCVTTVQLFSLIALRHLIHAKFIFRFNVILVGIYFIFLVFIGGANGTGILWAFIFPLFAFFLLGSREGLLLSLLHVVLLALIIITPNEILGSFAYQNEIKLRFLVTYSLIILMGYFVEITRKRYQVDMEQAHQYLEDRVERRTAELSLANKQLQKEIRDRKKTEGELTDAYEIINKSPAVAFLWKNESGWPVEFVTANIEPLLGYPPDDLISGKVSYVDIVHPDDLDRVANEVQSFSREKGRQRFDHVPYRIVTRNGTVKWVRDSTFIRRDQNGDITHYQGIVEDITDRKEAEKSLRESEERFRELAENIREVFWLFDWEKQKVLYVSPAYEEIWGRSIKDLMERYEEWGDSIHLDDLKLAQESFENIIETGGGEPREYRIIRPDGSIRWILDRGVAIKGEDGRVLRIAGIAEDITERKKAEKQLKATESNYRALFEAEPDGILIVDSKTGIIVDANPSVLNLYGYSYDEICGMAAVKLSAEPEKSKMHIDSIAKEAQGGPTAPVAYRRHRKKDGTEFPVEIMHGLYQIDGQTLICAIMRDITERRRIEAALAASEQNYREIFEKTNDAMLVHDLEGNILDVNQAVLDLSGFTREEALNSNIQDFTPGEAPNSQNDGIRAIKKALNQGPQDFEWLGQRKTGEQYWAEINLKHAIIGGEDRVIAVIQDVTERKQVSEELETHRKHLEELVQERTRELEVTQEELLKNERLAVLGQLTATVSHELRNPLGVIRSSAFYLQRKNQEQDQKIIKHINRIEDQVEICDSIVSDLLEYTRGRHSQMVVGEINPWLEQVLDELPAVHEIKLEVNLEANMPQMHFDKEKMRQVMVNLIDNAHQAIAEQKQIRGNDSNVPQIEITSKTSDTDIVIQVKDNGIGMDSDTRDRAFEPLFTTRARGTGLGLANVKKIIDEHKGTVSLQSKPNEGTAVILAIPAVNQE
jgi:PAS domain S-box-containing protein